MDSLSPLADLIYPIAFLSFFVVAGLAILFNNRRRVRTGFVVFLIIILTVVGLVGADVLPATNLHKYTGAADEEMTHSEVRIVDEHGNEIALDNLALPYGAHTGYSGEMVDGTYSDDENQAAAAFLLENANEYRSEIEDGDRSRLESARYPPSSRNSVWTVDELEEYGEFEAIRIYEIRLGYESDGYELEDTTEEPQLEVTPE